MASATDLDGNVRVFDDAPDMGCYEWFGVKPGFMLIYR